jgi:hypothetical protein
LAEAVALTDRLSGTLGLIAAMARENMGTTSDVAGDRPAQ